MANSRFDNIKYFDGSTFKVPKQIKVYDESNWVDLGEKTSYNKKKLMVRDTNSFKCVTYERQDVNIPGYTQFGGGKYADVRKGDGSIASVDNWKPGYRVVMTVEVQESCRLYFANAFSSGDIEYAFNSYYADVSGNAVRFRAYSMYNGNMSDAGGRYGRTESNEATPYCWTKGEKVRIELYKSVQNGSLNVKVYNPSNVLLCNVDLKEKNFQVYTARNQYLGGSGSFKLYSFSITPIQNRDSVFSINCNDVNSGSTRIYSGGYGGYLDLHNTSTYKANYSVYNRQSI